MKKNLEKINVYNNIFNKKHRTKPIKTLQLDMKVLSKQIKYHWTFMQTGQHKTNLPWYSLRTVNVSPEYIVQFNKFAKTLKT